MTIAERIVNYLTELAARDNWNDRTNAELAALLNLNEPSVRRVTRQLTQRGVLKRIEYGGFFGYMLHPELGAAA